MKRRWSRMILKRTNSQQETELTSSTECVRGGERKLCCGVCLPPSLPLSEEGQLAANDLEPKNQYNTGAKQSCIDHHRY